MRIPHSALPTIRLAVLASFVGVCSLLFGYLWVNMGGTIPGVTDEGYRVSVKLQDADNLVYDSDVMIAGVKVGSIRAIEPQRDSAHVTMQLDTGAPLHKGAQVLVRAKSLVEETYLEIDDGHGAVIPSGGELPADAVQPSVQLNDVLTSLDQGTRDALGNVVRSLGAATQGSREDIDRTMTGLGLLGREGHDVLDAVAAQSEDLTRLTRNTTVLLRSLDTRRGQIVSLVDHAHRLLQVTSHNRSKLERTMVQLPQVMGSARDASGHVQALAAALVPVARDLDKASPHLSRALQYLPATTRDLRGLLPAFDEALVRAPSTLRRVPVVAADARAIIPTLRTAQAEVNPMAAFLRPYGMDIAAFFANWSAMMQQSDANGHYLRIFPVFNEQSLKNYPFETNDGPLNKSNAYPRPGQATHPAPFDGSYPRVRRGKR